MSFWSYFHISWPIFVTFDVRHLHMLSLRIYELLKIGAGMTLLFLWAYMGLHLRVYRETVRYSEGKEHLGKVCVPSHGVHQLQSVVTEGIRVLTFTPVSRL
jgi:hypothetical protein